jgi:hypothetical protein
MILWGQRKVSIKVALDMFFARHSNMGLLWRKFAKTRDSYQLRMCNLTCKSALLSRKVW